MPNKTVTEKQIAISNQVFGNSTIGSRLAVARTKHCCAWPIGRFLEKNTSGFAPFRWVPVFCCEPTETVFSYCPIHCDDAYGRDLERK